MKHSLLNLTKQVSLRQLQVFLVISRHKNFTKAAEELHLAQPTVSTQMKRLSEAVGLPLFEHIGRNVYLTETGKYLQEACMRAFDGLDEFERRVSNIKGLHQGKVSLGVVTTAKYFAPVVLGDFCQLHPGVDVLLKVTNRDRILERISKNEDDVYILGDLKPEDYDLLVAHSFAPNPLYVVARKDHPLAQQRSISLKRLADEVFIMREQGSGIRESVDAIFAERGLTLKVRMELGSNEAIKHSIIGRLGVSVLSLHTLPVGSTHKDLAILDVEGFPIQRHWNIVYPKGKELSLAASAFVEFTKQEGKGLVNHLALSYQAMQ